MSEENKIIQSSVLGSGTTQIGVQNNYNINNSGITPVQAAEIATKLFLDNFPKLQEAAMNEARRRADEFCKELIGKMQKQDNVNYSAFTEPDVQFVLNKVQQEYARFGTEKLKDLLSDIIVNRINYNDDYFMKIILDEAIEIAKYLTDAHLNYLSLIFLCKQIIFHDIKTINDLEKHCIEICSGLPVPESIVQSVPFLNMMRLLTISLGLPVQVYSKRYGLNASEVEKILPNAMKTIPGDYVLSPVGVVIAIINIQKKMGLKIDFQGALKPY